MAKPIPMPLTNHLTGLPLNCQRCGRPFTAITQTKITDDGMVCKMGKWCDTRVDAPRVIKGQFVQVIEFIEDKRPAIKHPWYPSRWYVLSLLPVDEPPQIIDNVFMGNVAKAREVVAEWDSLVAASRIIDIAKKGATAHESQGSDRQSLLRMVA